MDEVDAQVQLGLLKERIAELMIVMEKQRDELQVLALENETLREECRKGHRLSVPSNGPRGGQ